MAIADIQEYLKLIPAVNKAPQHALWLTYDAEADTLYVNFKKPSVATDSEMTDDDIIIRYEGEEVIGYTVLHASKRVKRPRSTRPPVAPTRLFSRKYFPGLRIPFGLNYCLTAIFRSSATGLIVRDCVGRIKN